jgi:hypothetical protein
MNSFVSGLVAGLPLSALGVIYSMLRFEGLADLFREGDAEMAAMGEGPMRLMLLAMFGLGPLFLGGIAGLVYGAIGSQQTYLVLAIGIATIASILALLSRTPMMSDKIIMNYIVAVTLGLLIPHMIGN